MNQLAPAKSIVAATYSAAAEHFDDPPLAFWSRIGNGTVSRVPLRPGDRVLDVCCGSGASAIPAAQAVGSRGSVLAVDLSDALLDRGRAKARALGLQNIDFRCADFEAIDVPPEHFDAVVCVFGIFFAADIPPAVQRLWRWIKPGGTLAITTWGPDVLEPGNTAFWEAIRGHRPDLYRSFRPWERINTSDSLREMLAEAGVTASSVDAEHSHQTLDLPDDWWTIALGSGYRGTIDRLDPDTLHAVKRDTLGPLRARNALTAQTNALYAVATKPSLSR
ncbi:class I SAM-dependent methyltransferase [Polyangium jinanense]|uniref:Methyltransferase domain-containing protein n=1 Tax=Polyangium jinanense TaxID=2829994 RepID=A0A9X3XC37_9BACT|nr:methyltransferase domain-containing protein [Polyangium jinanense]MDC3961574.1 methyltransferase domain-containing protein [Polyangium jinanense]MDC3987939.1 methyltransferase domain-containing protein [Polyangium jinanense]